LSWRQTRLTEALAYIAELVSEFAPPHEANDKLYRMVKACIEALASFADRPDMVVRYSKFGCCVWRGCFQTCATARSVTAFR